jgi:hypothetical protein
MGQHVRLEPLDHRRIDGPVAAFAAVEDGVVIGSTSFFNLDRKA